MNNLKILKWLRLRNIIPLFTILGAGFALILSFLEVLNLSISENIVIGLLALISADALIERLHILEKIELKLSQMPTISILRKRTDIIPMNQFAKDASSICVLAISAYTIISPYQVFYEGKLKDNCNLKFLLLSPNSQYLDAYNQQNKTNIIAKDHIKNSIEILVPLLQKFEGLCEIRLSKIFLPFSMVGIDLDKKTGKMNIEYHCYKLYLDERPHIIIEKESNPHWFDNYKRQFEIAWLDGEVKSNLEELSH